MNAAPSIGSAALGQTTTDTAATARARGQTPPQRRGLESGEEREVAPRGDQSGPRGSAEGAAWRLEDELARVRMEATTLARALETCRDIGVAIGIVMAMTKVTRETAFEMLRLVSSHQNRKLHAVACDVVATGELPVR